MCLNSGISDSFIAVKANMSGSLVAASFTFSQVTAIILRIDDAEDANLFLISYEQDSWGQ